VGGVACNYKVVVSDNRNIEVIRKREFFLTFLSFICFDLVSQIF
jgi:hypothetical protein